MYEQPSLSSDTTDRNVAVAVHLGTLAAAFFSGGLLAFCVPLVALFVMGNRGAFSRDHIVEALNFQLSTLIVPVVAGVIALFVTIFTAGIGLVAIIPLAIVMVIGLVLIQLIGGIVGAMNASNGLPYRYPWTIRFIK
jgi:uncharacterized protein